MSGYSCKIAGNDCMVRFSRSALDGVIARWQEAGYAVVGPFEQPWLWREAYLSDPDHNPILLFDAGENRLDPPWRL